LKFEYLSIPSVDLYFARRTLDPAATGTPFVSIRWFVRAL
jgi:hypothetical protein